MSPTETTSSQQSAPDETLLGDESLPQDRATPQRWEPGALVDRYVLTAELGRGAAGVVYSAVDPELDRRIALKLLRPGRGRTAQLRDEAQALAKVSSPHVVAVYDVGTMDDEIFIAMEFVHGQTLATWLAGQPRGVRAVLQVFMEAAQGLAAVHAAGLVHGDFKPANVMVDEAGRARVLDFGLARRSRLFSEDGSTAAAPDPARTVSAGYGVMGTPAYMSPEQASGTEIDAASDQFSFCVSLWEALYGQRPFSGEGFYEIAAALIEQRPSVPSNRRVAPSWLYRTLLRGLAREPAARWPSMDALVQELSRDRARRRSRVALTLGACAFIGTWAWWQQGREASRCAREANRAIALWNEDREATVREAIGRTERLYAADAADRIVERADGYARAWHADYQEICLASHGSMPDEIRTAAYSCLDRRRRALDTRLTALVDVQAEAALRGIEALESLPSIAACSDVGLLATDDDEPDDPTVARAVDAVRDRLAEAEATALVGRYEAARDLARAAIENAEELDYLPIRASAHLELGYLLLVLGELEPARDELRVAYTLAVSSERAVLAAKTALDLARLEGVHAGNAELGREWAFHAAAHLAREGMRPMIRAEYYSTLGLLESKGQHVDEAIGHFEHALQIRRQELGEETLGIASEQMNLAAQLRAKGDYEGAWSLQRDTLAIMRETLGEHHPNVAIAYNNAAATLISMGRIEQARDYLERSQTIADEALPQGHPSLAFAFSNLSRAQLDEGDLSPALEACDRALGIREATLPPDHLHIVYTLVDRAEILRRIGRLPEARLALARALAVVEARDDPEHPGLSESLTSMGLLLLAEGRPSEALPLLERALGLLSRPAADYGDGKKAITQFELARASWLADQDREGARSQAKSALEQLERDPAARSGALRRDLDEMRRWVHENMD